MSQPGNRAGRRAWLCAVVAAMLLLGIDLGRAPDRQVSARALLVGIDLYQATFSSLFSGAGMRCRFQPTCSHYGEESIRRHGALQGGGRTLWRILRCGPWTEMGTVDPP